VYDFAGEDFEMPDYKITNEVVLYGPDKAFSVEALETIHAHLDAALHVLSARNGLLQLRSKVAFVECGGELIKYIDNKPLEY